MSYIDEDEEVRRETDPQGETKTILIQFFKEIAQKNMSGFQQIYDHLSDEEKHILTENIV